MRRKEVRRVGGSLDRSGYLFSREDLRKLIVPLIIEQFLSITVGLADSIMVAWVGEAAVSAVSLIDTIMVLLINTFTALATGGAIVAGQALGRRKEQEGCRATEQLVLVAAVFATAIMAVVYIGKWFILHVVFGRIEPDVMANCETYLMIVAASSPFLAVYNAGAAAQRAMGDSKTPMITSLAMNGVNLVGNAILLYGLGWGIEGAAIPTLISRIFAGVCMLVLLKNPKKVLHIQSYRRIRPDWNLIRKILRIGIPYGLENSMFQLGKIVVISLVSGFGTAATTANAVANTVSTFSILVGTSMGYALSAVSAQCVGARAYDQVRYYTKKLTAMSYLGLWIMNLLIFLLLPVITAAYQLTPETAQLARQLGIYNGVCAMVIWPLSFTLPNTLRSAGDASFCMTTAMFSMWTFRVAFSFVLADTFSMGVLGVWVAMTLDWLVRSVVFSIRYAGQRWQVKAAKF